MKITVDRSSVCMGDDMEPHEKTYELPDDADCHDLLKVLLTDSFFAYIRGNDVVWYLSVGDMYFAYLTKSGRCETRGDIRLSALGNSLRFHYGFSSEAWERIKERLIRQSEEGVQNEA